MSEIQYIDRKQAIIQTLNNYLETGVITPASINQTAHTLANLDDNELIIFLLESHICREHYYSHRAFRCLN